MARPWEPGRRGGPQRARQRPPLGCGSAPPGRTGRPRGDATGCRSAPARGSTANPRALSPSGRGDLLTSACPRAGSSGSPAAPSGAHLGPESDECRKRARRSALCPSVPSPDSPPPAGASPPWGLGDGRGRAGHTVGSGLRCGTPSTGRPRPPGGPRGPGEGRGPARGRGARAPREGSGLPPGTVRARALGCGARLRACLPRRAQPRRLPEPGNEGCVAAGPGEAWAASPRPGRTGPTGNPGGWEKPPRNPKLGARSLKTFPAPATKLWSNQGLVQHPRPYIPKRRIAICHRHEGFRQRLQRGHVSIEILFIY